MARQILNLVKVVELVIGLFATHAVIINSSETSFDFCIHIAMRKVFNK